MTQEQWEAIRTDDASYDGKFYYAVRTTGVVCRPSCHARACCPENVVIFDTLPEALAAGYRPCRKCCPEVEDWQGTRRELARKLCDLVEKNYREKFSLDAIAGAMHMDKNYLIRVFREVNGMTMLQYHNMVRCSHAKALLERPDLSISYIGSEVGYKTPSHFTRIYKSVTGQTPGEYRQGYLSAFATAGNGMKN